ncbi:MAG TPA: SRPBCC family protein [Candidatus Binatia bacterium]|nr:SRPBCC family protein [Candidatus Binatia bacterium]
MKKPKLVYTTFIRSTPKKTWDAICKPEFTRQYWGEMANVSDWKKGSKWEHRTEENEVWIQGKVVECVPVKRLVLTWADPDDLKDVSRVTFEIEPEEDMVCLTVTHDKFKAGSKMAGKVSWGWPRVLSSLKSFLETGKGLNIFCGS